MTKLCAYCDKPGNLTKEHVWPAGFLQLFKGERIAHESKQTSKFHSSDYAVKDVCANCNNGNLSTLDAPWIALCRELLPQLDSTTQQIRFNYSYELLVRFLLKLSYNSSRSAGFSCQTLKSLRGHILNGGDRKHVVRVFVEFLRPSIVNGVLQEPMSYRCAGGPYGDKCLYRVVGVKYLYFHLLIETTNSIKAGIEKATTIFKDGCPDAYYLKDNESITSIGRSSQGHAKLEAPHLIPRMWQLRDYFNS